MAGSTHHEEPTARAMDGQVCLIVGAGEGIGRACAEAFVGEGTRVVLVARDANRLTNLAVQIKASTGSQAVTIAADLATPNVGRRVVDAAMAGFGRIDSVIAVATMAGRAALVDLDMDLLRQTFEVNVIGTLDVSRCAARVMTDAGRGGAIVHVSTLGTHSLPEKQSPYTATKAAMVSASMTMAKELGPAGIRVNVVTPGYVTGAPLDQLCEHVAGNEGIEPGAVSERLASTAALRRHVDPSDLAQAALFLAGPTGRNITGVELRVDAGQKVGP